VATDSGLAIDSGVTTETGVASLLNAASRLTSESVATETLPIKSGKSNGDAIIIDDDEKSLDDECYIYNEVSVIDLKHYSQLNKMLTCYYIL
jgi:hypothetical protein